MYNNIMWYSIRVIVLLLLLHCIIFLSDVLRPDRPWLPHSLFRPYSVIACHWLHVEPTTAIVSKIWLKVRLLWARCCKYLVYTSQSVILCACVCLNKYGTMRPITYHMDRADAGSVLSAWLVLLWYYFLINKVS